MKGAGKRRKGDGVCLNMTAITAAGARNTRTPAAGAATPLYDFDCDGHLSTTEQILGFTEEAWEFEQIMHPERAGRTVHSTAARPSAQKAADSTLAEFLASQEIKIAKMEKEREWAANLQKAGGVEIKPGTSLFVVALMAGVILGIVANSFDSVAYNGFVHPTLLRDLVVPVEILAFLTWGAARLFFRCGGGTFAKVIFVLGTAAVCGGMAWGQSISGRDLWDLGGLVEDYATGSWGELLYPDVLEATGAIQMLTGLVVGYRYRRWRKKQDLRAKKEPT